MASVIFLRKRCPRITGSQKNVIRSPNYLLAFQEDTPRAKSGACLFKKVITISDLLLHAPGAGLLLQVDLIGFLELISAHTVYTIAVSVLCELLLVVKSTHDGCARSGEQAFLEQAGKASHSEMPLITNPCICAADEYTPAT